MEKGETVVVYEDPITRKKAEGVARLIRLIDPDSGEWDNRLFQRWYVEFENSPGETFDRQIEVGYKKSECNPPRGEKNEI